MSDLHQETEKLDNPELMTMTSRIVASYVSKNPTPTDQVSDLISTVHHALLTLKNGPETVEELVLKPAVPIKKSIGQDYLICLEDGKKLKMLKRHLRTAYNMTPEDYRAKWGLPADYPMVAPSYAQQRSEFAKRIGLGRATRDGETDGMDDAESSDS